MEGEREGGKQSFYKKRKKMRKSPDEGLPLHSTSRVPQATAEEQAQERVSGGACMLVTSGSTHASG